MALKRPRYNSHSSTESRQSSSSELIIGSACQSEWPAPASALSAARAFLQECAQRSRLTLLVPDKDADGLSSALIVYRTLCLLGHTPLNLKVHLLSKGSNPHRDEERSRMKEYEADYAIVLDQGSRAGPPLMPVREDGTRVKTLLVDHHLTDVFPEDALVLSACKYPPIATSSTLAYVLCKPLHPEVQEQTDYLCAIGTHGDLGTSFKWESPFPGEDMKGVFKKYTKKAVNDAVSLVNGPRRTAKFDVISGWNSLMSSKSPTSILNNSRLLECKQEIAAEVTRCTRSAPTFSADGKVALLRLKSGAQVHPLIATRWASSLRSPGLQIVVAANDGYLPSMTNFACRVARSALASSSEKSKGAKKEKDAVAPAFKKFKSSGGAKVSTPADGTEDGPDPANAEPDIPDISIIRTLEHYASLVPGLREEMGDDYARGHAHASGGIVRTELFEKLWSTMCNPELVGPPPERVGKTKKASNGQRNTLEGWFKKK